MSTPEPELNVGAELLELLNAVTKAHDAVLADGTSYRHMPDWYRAINAVGIYVQQVSDQRVRTAVLGMLQAVPHARGCPLSLSIGEQCLCAFREVWQPVYAVAKSYLSHKETK